MKILLKVFLGTILIVAVILMVRSNGEREMVRSTILKNIENAAVSQIQIEDLVKSLDLSNSIDAQAKQKEAEVQGKIIQWVLEADEIIEKETFYRINMRLEKQKIGIVIFIYPSDPQDHHFMRTLKAGGKIKIKGMIKRVSNGKIRINPAILLS